MKYVAFLLVAVAIIFGQSDYQQDRDYEDIRREFMTIALDGNYFLGEMGRIGGGIDMSFNLPAGMVIGINATGGNFLTDIDNWYYYSSTSFAEDSSHFIGELSDGQLTAYLGYETKPAGVFNPFVSAGIGFYFVTYKVKQVRREIVRDPVTDSLRSVNVYHDGNYSTDIAATVPITVGINSRFIDWLQATCYVRYDMYLANRYLYGKETDIEPTVENTRIDLNKWRGNFAVGLKLAIPVKLEI